jgi:hypothetical protein
LLLKIACELNLVPQLHGWLLWDGIQPTVVVGLNWPIGRSERHRGSSTVLTSVKCGRAP